MNWQKVATDPNLQNLPYKIETNEQGQIIMTPGKTKHGALQSKIAALLLQRMPTGVVVTECAIHTAGGTKVADSAWFSDARWPQVAEEYEASVAAEICVEVLSPSNSTEEMERKRNLYFAAGAEEVWICTEDGTIRFYDETGELADSARAPNFPTKVTV